MKIDENGKFDFSLEDIEKGQNREFSSSILAKIGNLKKMKLAHL